MLLDLVERLICPNPHATTPLIIVASEVADRVVISGFAGCPVCHLEARISGGETIFPGGTSTERGKSANPGSADIRDHAGTGSTDMGNQNPGVIAPSPERIERTIALLGLSEPGGSILLGGAYAGLAPDIATAAGVSVVIVDADEVKSGPERSVFAVRGGADVIPFGEMTFRAAAVSTVSEQVLRVVAMNARVLAPANEALLSGLSELARDGEEWVAERQLPAVQLSRRRTDGL